MISIPKLSKFDFLVLIVIVMIGLIHLPFPLGGDQSLFTLGALEMQQGKVLYRDFWDLKQPGIYYFYFLAGSLFGFNEIGIHLFEFIYMMLFSVILLLTLKSYFQHQVIASLVPLLTVGVYYVVSNPSQLTQVEALIGFPLFLCLWLTYQSFKCEGKQRFFQLLSSGLIGGIILLFKLMFLLILLSFWGTLLVNFIFIKRQSFQKAFVKICLPIFLGVIFPILVVISYFAWSNSLSIVYETFFVYPVQIVANSKFSIIKFLRATRWFLQGFFPLIFMAIVAVYVSLRKSNNLLTWLLVIWCISGMGVICLQRHSLWDYHYLLLFVPVGILATKGLDILWQPLKDLISPIIATLLLFLFFLPLFLQLQFKSVALVQNNFALTEQTRFKYQSVFRKEYPSLHSEVDFLSKPGNLSGDIFIIGDPSLYYLSGRNQATSLNGWSVELFVPQQWTELLKELDSSKPAYIFIHNTYKSMIKEKSPKMLEFLEQKYRIEHQSNRGTWYILNVS
ncbi:glycosyltransferase family 39 protein [aff. Roholtiella sp. LEGE 12411]|uniref:glycosyltransferase family 39 protein n=1 Tax=aff. Roholtiella sp. LEGE 12411 TaxID=1828822 RepID=UPI0018803E90|nr:glycosyltransferase family 39 protein [aff. Roholtiella sp. LEGE 12411]MBE9034787.1 glycosyltransferase family 39 protein [aff. Roholtiella sp. LEGE 12411]